MLLRIKQLPGNRRFLPERRAKPQNNMQTATNSAQAYNNGYQAGVAAGTAQASQDQQQAYNEGYATRGLQDRRVAEQAFDNGYDAGASRHTSEVVEFP